MERLYIYLDKIDSTNAYASKWLAKNKPSQQICIYSQHQYAGKGQFGRKWTAESGKSLTFSLIVPFKNVPVQQQILINMKIASDICAFLRKSFDTDFSIKWPNDIYFEKKKIGGLLIQNLLSGKFINQTIIGLGLNINQEDFSNDLPNPVSLYQITGKKNSIHELMYDLLEHISLTDIVKQEKEILDNYNEVLFQKGKEQTFASQGYFFSAKVKGVNTRGELVLERGGRNTNYSYGELTWNIK